MLKINPPPIKGRVLSTKYSKSHKLLLKLVQIMSIIKVLFFVTQVYRVYIFLATMSNSTAEIILKQNHTGYYLPSEVLSGEVYLLDDAEAMNIANDMVTSFGLVQALGVMFAPLNGIIIDKCEYLHKL